MKTLIAFTLLSILGVSNAFAKNACEVLSSKAVTDIVVTEYNLGWSVEDARCELAPNKGAVLCFVFGSHEDGAGTKDFQVVVSRDCKKVYDVRLIGEE